MTRTRKHRKLLSHLTAERIDQLCAQVTVAPSGCWEWHGGKSKGYASIRVGTLPTSGKAVNGHRIFWTWFHQEDVKDGLVLDHLCENRACVNPGHLEPVTYEENVSRGASSDYCKNGHPKYGPEADVYQRSNGYVECRTCLTRPPKTHCLRGHSLEEPSNVYRSPKRPNSRHCKECRKVREKARMT